MLRIIFVFLSAPLWTSSVAASDENYICRVSTSVVDRILSEQQSIAQKLDQLVARLQLRSGSTDSTSAVVHPIPSNCKQAIAQSGRSGIHKIQVSGFSEKPFLVACDNVTESGGWTVFQRRVNNKIDFYRGWSEYQRGFGNLESSFWIGLDKLHALTNSCVQELMIRLTDAKNVTRYAKYEVFAIGDETQDYALTVLGAYSGTAGDSLQYHAGSKFTTNDRDNDSGTNNCAVLYQGAWWYDSCYLSNLNGNYSKSDGQGITWNSIEKDKALKFAEMMIRPKDDC